MSTFVGRRLLLLGAALLAATVSGCRLDATVRIDYAEDGSSIAEVMLVADREFENNFALLGMSLGEAIAARGALLGVSFQASGNGDGTAYRTVVRAGSPADLERVLTALLPGLESLTVTTTDDTMRFSGEVAPLTTTPELESLFDGFEAESFADSFGATVEVGLAGEVVDSSADRVTSGRLVWEVALDDAATLIGAESITHRPFPWATAAVLAVAAVFVMFLLAVRRAAGSLSFEDGGTLDEEAAELMEPEAAASR